MHPACACVCARMCFLMLRTVIDRLALLLRLFDVVPGRLPVRHLAAHLNTARGEAQGYVLGVHVEQPC